MCMIKTSSLNSKHLICVYVDGAAEQRAELQCFPYDVEQERWRLLQVVALSDASGEILKALDAGASGQSFIGAVHPDRQRPGTINPQASV